MAEKKSAKRPRTVNTQKTGPPEKRIYFKQTDFPQTTLQQAQKIASALMDNFTGNTRK